MLIDYARARQVKIKRKKNTQIHHIPYIPLDNLETYLFLEISNVSKLVSKIYNRVYCTNWDLDYKNKVKRYLYLSAFNKIKYKKNGTWEKISKIYISDNLRNAIKQKDKELYDHICEWLNI